jgi:flagellar basal body rod protein FlgG
MAADALSIALSGISGAHKRVEAASHNVANLLTEDFRPVRVLQSSRASGGSTVEVEQAAEPEPVSLAREFIESDLAAIQAKASARIVEVDLDMLGSLLDILA